MRASVATPGKSCTPLASSAWAAMAHTAGGELTRGTCCPQLRRLRSQGPGSRCGQLPPGVSALHGRGRCPPVSSHNRLPGHLERPRISSPGTSILAHQGRPPDRAGLGTVIMSAFLTTSGPSGLQVHLGTRADTNIPHVHTAAMDVKYTVGLTEPRHGPPPPIPLLLLPRGRSHTARAHFCRRRQR